MPQGSVLGPLLFLIYVNDLPDFIQNANFVIFADDTTFVQKDANLDELLRNIDTVSNQVYQWFESNKLTLNQNKTKKLIFSLRALAEYKDQEPAKFLGVILDPKLTWDKHVDMISNRLVKYVYLFRTLHHEVSDSVLKSC